MNEMTKLSGDALSAKVRELSGHRSQDWARGHFRDTVVELIQLTGAKSVLEIGGGRFPALKRPQIEALGIDYTVSDILQSELDLAPAWVSTFPFDITTQDRSSLESHRGRYDFAFSKWVMEHVSDYHRAYANIHEILAEGGVHIAWHPILFSPPFVLNSMIPDSVSGPLLRVFFPHRNDDETPKFPAVYSGCRISANVRKNIAALGFRDVWQLPFWGHRYYQKIPGLRELHQVGAQALAAANVTPLASFAFTIVRK